MTRRLASMLAFAGLLLAGPAFAQSRDARVDEVLRTAFQAWDANGDGTLVPDEGERYIARIWGSMDTDGNGRVTLAEFQGFSLGLLAIAQESGREPAYNDARTAIFRRWARNPNQGLTQEEARTGITGDFARAVRGGATGGVRLDFEGFKRVQFVQDMVAPLR